MMIALLIIFISSLSLLLAKFMPDSKYKFVLPASILVLCSGLGHYLFTGNDLIHNTLVFGKLIEFRLDINSTNLDMVLISSIVAFCSSLSLSNSKIMNYSWMIVLPYIASSGALISGNLFTFALFLEALQLIFNFNCLNFGSLNNLEKRKFIYYQGFSFVLSMFFIMGTILSSLVQYDSQALNLLLLSVGLLSVFIRIVLAPLLDLLNERKVCQTIIYNYLGFLIPAYAIFIGKYLILSEFFGVGAIAVSLILLFFFMQGLYIKSSATNPNILALINLIFSLLFFVVTKNIEGQSFSGLFTFLVLTNFAFMALRDSGKKKTRLALFEIIIVFFIINTLLLLPGSPVGIALENPR